MDLLTLVRTAVRRWYVVAPVLLVALSLAVATQATTAPQYQAVGSVLLEEPTFDSSRLPRSIVSADLLAAGLNDPETSADLTTQGTELAAQATDQVSIEIAASGPDGDASEQAVEAALGWARQRSLELQDAADVPEAEQLQANLEAAFPVSEEQPDGTFVASTVIRLSDPGAGLENPFTTGERTSRMLEAVIMSDVGGARVAQQTGGTVAYTVTISESESSILEILTVSGDPADALGGFATVREELNAELDRRQSRAGIPPSWRIVVNDLAPPQSAGDISPPIDRAAVAIMVAGILLAIGATVAVDGPLTRRREAQRGGPRRDRAHHAPRRSPWSDRSSSGPEPSSHTLIVPPTGADPAPPDAETRVSSAAHGE